MQDQSVMQQALGEQWDLLPAALQAHYSCSENNPNLIEQGLLSVAFPKWMQWPLHGLRLLGALVDKAEQDVPTTVQRHYKDNTEYWTRTLRYKNGKNLTFTSHSLCSAPQEVTEFTNSMLAMRMRVAVKGNELTYQSNGYVIKLGKWLIPIPEWLALGYGSIVETAVDDKTFMMDFRLRHPLFGEIFRYNGTFKTAQFNVAL